VLLTVKHPQVVHCLRLVRQIGLGIHLRPVAIDLLGSLAFLPGFLHTTLSAVKHPQVVQYLREVVKHPQVVQCLRLVLQTGLGIHLCPVAIDLPGSLAFLPGFLYTTLSAVKHPQVVQCLRLVQQIGGIHLCPVAIDLLGSLTFLPGFPYTTL
jgi:hypothetical protein